MKRILSLIALILIVSCAADAKPRRKKAADPYAKPVGEAFASVIPTCVNVGTITAKSVVINDNARLVTVTANDNVGYLPLTPELIDELKGAVLEALPESKSGYRVKILSNGFDIETLARGAEHPNRGPSERGHFVQRHRPYAIPKGIDGSNIAIWQSHGRYFDNNSGEWRWQRPPLFCTVEDLFTQGFVVPLLIPMLENAGGYVLMPRERDPNPVEIIIDNDGRHAAGTYSEKNGKNHWADAPGKGFAYTSLTLDSGDNPFREGTARRAKTVADDSQKSEAHWNAHIPVSGDYAIYVSYATAPSHDAATDARYVINHAGGSSTFVVDQTRGAGTWVYLGTFPLREGKSLRPIVELSNHSAKAGSIVTADAVKIGGGMGNVLRGTRLEGDSVVAEGTLSGLPRSVEGARYWLQWAGMPESVYASSDESRDYNDDFRSRALWVNYMAGGSSMLPDSFGLRVPIDLSIGFHTDAGVSDSTIIGTLGIYSTDGGSRMGNGGSRLASRDLLDEVITTVVDDIREQFDSTWTRRGMWDKRYHEVRATKVPSIILELLSHQNFNDMKYGRDPRFRFTVARAVYKGILKYIARRDGRSYVVQPLPPRRFAIANVGGGKYRLSWQPTPDPAEPTAKPTHYIVEHRTADGGFAFLADTDATSLTVSIKDGQIHSYRILAANDGGVSFPSETLALCAAHHNAEEVLIVNAFTRISGPEWFESDTTGGFLCHSDGGVPYISDITYAGAQYDFDKFSEYANNDVPGFGASRQDNMGRPVAGNTFDFPYIHGEAIRHAGHPFVSSSLDAFVASDSSVPKVVDLILGKQIEIEGAEALRKRLKNLLQRGTALMVSGSLYGEKNPWLCSDVGALWSELPDFSGVVNTTTASHWFGRHTIECCPTPNPYTYAVEQAGILSPMLGAQTLLYYEPLGESAAVAFEGLTYRAVAFGFPFETIDSEKVRQQLMKHTLTYLTNKHK